MRQMQMLVSVVLMPFFGKWWGRRWSYWGELSDLQYSYSLGRAVEKIIVMLMNFIHITANSFSIHILFLKQNCTLLYASNTKITLPNFIAYDKQPTIVTST